MTVILKLVFFQNPFLVSFCHRYKSYLCNVIITKLMTIKNTHEAARVSNGFTGREEEH
ncbi:MAG: hypothetical protein WAM42_14110 [Candidatus Nitrosopolaris sp.]